jgi:hypothetical protein
MAGKREKREDIVLKLRQVEALQGQPGGEGLPSQHLLMMIWGSESRHNLGTNRHRPRIQSIGLAPYNSNELHVRQERNRTGGPKCARKSRRLMKCIYVSKAYGGNMVPRPGLEPGTS